MSGGCRHSTSETAAGVLTTGSSPDSAGPPAALPGAVHGMSSRTVGSRTFRPGPSARVHSNDGCQWHVGHNQYGAMGPCGWVEVQVVKRVTASVVGVLVGLDCRRRCRLWECRQEFFDRGTDVAEGLRVGP